MKKFLIAGTSLAAVAAAGSAGAVDVTLGGSINMGAEYGLGKGAGNLTLSGAFNEVSLSINAAHTTDGGLAFGGGFTMGTAAELKFNPYATAAGKQLVKATVTGATDLPNQLWAVSGGAAIDSGAVVSVKINSAWRGLGDDQTLYQVPLSSFTSSNICKLAGRGTVGGDAAVSQVVNGSISSAASGDDYDLDDANNQYLPAGQFAAWTSQAVSTAGPSGTLQISATEQMSTTRGAVAVVTGGADADTSGVVTVQYSDTAVTSKGTYNTILMVTKAAVAMDGDTSDFDVTSAAVFMGPFMEVRLASSETKMVVGAACLTGVDASDTAFYMDNASKVMTVSDASIYIEGGFGRLTLQSGDYAGGVGAIAGAGDQADIDADGLVVVAQGLGLMGANPYLAMDLAAEDALSDIEMITGGTLDLGGLAAGFDMVLGNGDDLLSITAWDLGLAYNMGDMSLAAAMDSSSDWGLSASMAVAGFGVNATFGSSSSDEHEKAGITYSVTATTSLNGFGLSIGFDEDLEPAIGVDYDLGGLVLYAGYDADDEGGSIGATLSF